MTEIYRFLERGGPLMIPIIAGSIAALGIFQERLYMLQRNRVVPEDLIKQVIEFVRKGRMREAKALCANGTSPVAAILGSVLQAAPHGRERMREVAQEVGKREVAELERYLEALGTIAALEPLMGLLGTVTGLIKVFQSVPATGVPEPGVLATGIWEALITTAAGLSVALPTFVAYKYVGALVDRLTMRMEEASSEIVDLLSLPGTPGALAAAEAEAEEAVETGGAAREDA